MRSNLAVSGTKMQITTRLPAVHGAPVSWACGVTPQAAIAAAKVPFAITHAPGYMLATDLKNAQFAV
jgi:uncharacterized protein YcsI (UPF0317 family)